MKRWQPDSPHRGVPQAAKFLPLLVFLLARPGFAQFELQLLEGTGERTAPAVYDLGETGSARFRLRNATGTDVTAASLAIAGVGFSLAAPSLPVTLSPSMSLEFSVNFHATELGAYSAVLHAENVSILVTASVVPHLTYRVENSPVGDIVDFGGAERGIAVHRRFTVANETPQRLTVPAISISGTDFRFPAQPPSGALLAPQQSAAFLIDFVPSSNGEHQAILRIGDRGVSLNGMGLDPPLPRPSLSVELQPVASSQQGILVVTFDQPAQSTGSGLATLDFRGSADPTVTFAAGRRTLNFSVSPGDTRIALPFQTGTTAGSMVFFVSLGQVSESLTLQIPTSLPVIRDIQGVRIREGVEVRVTGWDNTHSVRQMDFTFYDAGGAVLSPGTLRIDVSADFARFYSNSDSGGAFAITADFPVRGDTAGLSSLEVSLTDLIGTTKSARIRVE